VRSLLLAVCSFRRDAGEPAPAEGWAGTACPAGAGCNGSCSFLSPLGSRTLDRLVGGKCWYEK